MVIGFNLCPFAKKPWQRKEIRFTHISSEKCEEIVESCSKELSLLESTFGIETTLLVLPALDNDFYAFLDVIEAVDLQIDELGYRGEFQLAHFHPEYLFGGESPKSSSHFTNRAPHSTLHIIREDTITKVMATYPDPQTIPLNNIATMERLGNKTLQALLESFKNS